MFDALLKINPPVSVGVVLDTSSTADCQAIHIILDLNQDEYDKSKDIERS